MSTRSRRKRPSGQRRERAGTPRAPGSNLRDLPQSTSLFQNSNRQDDRLEAGELQAPLDGEGGLVVQEAIVEAIVLENELAHVEDRSREFLADMLAELDHVLDRLGADDVAVVGTEPEVVGEGDVLLQILN